MLNIRPLIPVDASLPTRTCLDAVAQNFSELASSKLAITREVSISSEQTRLVILPGGLLGRDFRLHSLGTVDTTGFSGTVDVSLVLTSNRKEVQAQYFGTGLNTQILAKIAEIKQCQLGVKLTLTGTGVVTITASFALEVI